ncbi:MAG: prepilin peptidase [Chloroflexi bacterium]|nr:prepilin peptidase [Chloroflexota bacterium]
MDILLIALLGLAAGGGVNLLADNLAAGTVPRRPRYPDGSRRPWAAWLGLSAFILGLRMPHSDSTDDANTALERGPTLGWRYPLVELALSLLMALTFAIAQGKLAQPGGKILIWLSLAALFVLIAIVDLEHRRIPRAPLLLVAALAIVAGLAYPQSPPSIVSMFAGAICAGSAFSLVYLGGRALKSLAPKRWRLPAEVAVFGRGDVHLMTVGGLIVGFPNALAAMALTIFLGGAGALLYIMATSAFGSGYKPFSTLPYGPFILAAVYIVMLWGGELQRLFYVS